MTDKDMPSGPLGADLGAPVAPHPPYHDHRPNGAAPVPGGGGYALSGAEFRACREAMGLSGADVAKWLGVGLRSVRRWEASEPPMWVAPLMDDLAAVAARWVADLAAVGAEGVAVVHHDGFRVVGPGWVVPEAWWRVVVGRTRRECPSLAARWGD